MRSNTEVFLDFFFDIPTALANMNLVFGDRIGGLSGSAASFISLYDIYGS